MLVIPKIKAHIVRKFGKSQVIENFLGRSEKAFLANLIPLIFIIYFFFEFISARIVSPAIEVCPFKTLIFDPTGI